MRRRKIGLALSDDSDKLSVRDINGQISLCLVYFIYVLSNSTFLIDAVPIEAKHGAFIIIAIISIFIQPFQCLLALFAIFPIILIYLLIGLPVYSLMVIVFAFALPTISTGIQSVIKRKDNALIFFLFIVSFLPLFLYFDNISSENLFDTTYGRPRMLLGYFHPKEAAISFAVPLILFMIARNSSSFLLWTLGATFLWLVGSRNIAIMFMLAWLFRWNTRMVLISLIPFFSFVLLWLLFSDSWVDSIDQLSSLRMSGWISALNQNSNFQSFDVISGERFGVDNFFVEIVVLGGLGMLVIALIWILFISIIVIKTSYINPWAHVCFIMLIFVASFDTGIASTGNMIHVLLWSIMLSSFFSNRFALSSFFRTFKR